MVDKKKEFRQEFGGPIGCFLTMTALPLIFITLVYLTVDLKSQYNEVSCIKFNVCVKVKKKLCSCNVCL